MVGFHARRIKEALFAIYEIATKARVRRDPRSRNIDLIDNPVWINRSDISRG